MMIGACVLAPLGVIMKKKHFRQTKKNRHPLIMVKHIFTTFFITYATAAIQKNPKHSGYICLALGSHNKKNKNASISRRQEGSVAQWIRRGSTEPEIPGSIPGRINIFLV